MTRYFSVPEIADRLGVSRPRAILRRYKMLRVSTSDYDDLRRRQIVELAEIRRALEIETTEVIDPMGDAVPFESGQERGFRAAAARGGRKGAQRTRRKAVQP